MFAGLTGYAYLGDMQPRQTEMRRPVALDTQVQVSDSAVAKPKLTSVTADSSSGNTDEPTSDKE